MIDKNLVHRDKDAVMTLYAHYFLAGDLMLKSYKRLSEKWKVHGRLSQNNRVQLSIYFCTWLGFLAVTAEGFKKLGVRKLLQNDRPPEFAELVPIASGLGKMLKKHDDALRKFRNNVFHLRDNVEEVELFFNERPGRLGWAEELQSSFAEFFSDYRVLCQMHYVLSNRTQEIIQCR